MSTPSEGPFALSRAEGIPGQGQSKGIWRLSWNNGSMVFSGWKKALDWLDNRVAKNAISGDSVILCGAYGVPWLLEWYLIAAMCAEEGNRVGVFDAYGKSAAQLLTRNPDWHEQLVAPWAKSNKWSDSRAS